MTTVEALIQLRDDIKEWVTNNLVALGGSSASGNTSEYSTDEIVCGTWIDGKTLYRKVVYIGNFTEAVYYAKDIADLAIDFCVTVRGIATSDGYTRPLPYAFDGSKQTGFIYLNTNNTKIALHNTAIALGDVYAILEYTKK